ncbi:uncharacterized protein LOC121249352 [Juglans microcarpa x Juglans regia]|uniref:uncharacterized protein LOC121249352 n=1 Tax=Juglans microcarpa x Juglans regia TaxID=2249226 RepID=UPI001B7E98B1|nr:uncharacterized protein LOC121249352 [Juglans microcarpa x Juglans regia]
MGSYRSVDPWLDQQLPLGCTPLSQVINKETSHEAWEVLETFYGQRTRDSAQHMKSELQSLQKGSPSMEEYLHRAKSLALALYGARRPMDDDDFIICILRDLGSKFDPIVAALNAKENFPSLEVVIGKLRDFELRVSATCKIHSPTTLYISRVSSTNANLGNASALSHQKYKGQRGSGHSQTSNPPPRSQPTPSRGGGRNNGYGGHITCFHCGSPNHKVDVCFATDEEVERYKAFLSIQVGDTMEELWFLNTSANQNMTPTTNDAQGIKNYTGTDKVTVGNGIELPISAIGHFSVPNTSLSINNALIVPEIQKKLISISQFTADNRCCFLYYPWGFLIKELATNR